MDTILPVQNRKNFSRNGKGVYESYSSNWKNQKSSVQIFWNLAKLVKNHRGIIVHQRLSDLRRMVLLKERYAELQKELLLYCCNPAWMKDGGRILWNASAICEMFKTCQMGKHSHSLWFDGRISSYVCKRPVKTPPLCWPVRATQSTCCKPSVSASRRPRIA